MTASVDVSISELTAMATKASRGVGFDWGMAEEAARATCWLAARDLPGPAALADLLDQLDGSRLPDHAPDASGTEWTATSGWLCPITSGAAMLDRAGGLSDGPPKLGATLCPILLMPAISEVWPDGIIDDLSDLSAKKCASIRITTEGQMRLAATSRALVPINVWARLSAYAQRTYAPATEASRLAGAGAGLNDND